MQRGILIPNINPRPGERWPSGSLVSYGNKPHLDDGLPRPVDILYILQATGTRNLVQFRFGSTDTTHYSITDTTDG